MIFSSLPLRRAAFGWSFLAVFASSQIGMAQPPDVPSNIRKPSAAPFGGFVLPPEPALITLPELQKLNGGPTLVTFSGQNVPITEATKALFDAAKMQFLEKFGPGRQNVTVDWQQMPFWSAAAELEKQTDRVWNTDYRGGFALNQMRSQSSPGFDGKMALQTPFVCLTANSIARTTTTTVSFAQNIKADDPNFLPLTSQIKLNLTAYFDPKLQVESAVLRSMTYYKQGEGAPIVPDDIRYGNSFAGRNSSISMLSCLLPKVVAGTNFSRVTGVLHSILVTATEPIMVANLLESPKITKTIGTNQFSLEAATLDNERITIRLNASAQGAAGVDAGFRGRLPSNLFNVLRVRDAQGNDLMPGGSSASIGGDKAQGTFTLNIKKFNGEIAPGPYSLEWKITTETRSFDVPFELRDITVP